MKSRNTLLIGEPMGLFIATAPGALSTVDRFDLTTCGAEFNVAVGMSRLEHPVSYVTKLGRDPFGQRIVDRMDSLGISTNQITFSDTHPTGFMFKSMVLDGDPDIFYFRRGSAASTLSPEDIRKLDFSRSGLLHVTGITPALSASARAAVETAVTRAKEEGLMFSFDPNIRVQLWPDPREMADVMCSLAARADIFLPGIKEVRAITGITDPEAAAEHFLALGTGCIVIKLGADGAYYATAKEKGYVPGFHVETIVDTVGAGDGFAAGVLTGLLEDLPLREAVRRGCAIGAIQLMSPGDNDGLPDREELARFMAGEKIRSYA